MSRFSICSYSQRKEDGRDWNILSIFIHPYPFSDEHLDEAVAPLLASEGPFDAVHFVGYPESLASVAALSRENTTVFKRMSKTIADFGSRSRLISISATTGQLECRTLEGETRDEPTLLEVEMRQSLQWAFIRRNGLVTANKGVHYAKPSGNHATQFLRAANVLEDSSAAFQIAFWLVSYIGRRPIKRIVVDTSGIASVAFALAHERIQCGLQAHLPVIESHSSYGGLKDLSVPDPDETLVLVSASTSGGLHSDLVDLGAKPENVVTLFYLGQKAADAGVVLCDLAYDEERNSNGLVPIANYPAGNCPHCKQHSYAIPITGDQFSTEPARIGEIDVALGDFSESHRNVLAQLVSTDLFKVFRSIDGRDFELYLDVDSMLSGSQSECPEAHQAVADLKTRWHRLVRRGMPVHLQRIVYTSYPGAKRMASGAQALLPTTTVSHDIGLIGSRDLQHCAVSPETATLVVSACLDETYELMGISRDLRMVQPGGNTTYVAPIFRASSRHERTRIESNLTFGEHGAKTFNLYNVIQIELPACEQLHSWKLEFEHLQRFLHWADLHDIVVPAEIEQRVATLRGAPAAGLSEALFWPAPNGEALRLGSDFTMIPTRDGRRHLSQADVFAVATSLFHQYRHGVNGKARLMYKPYERTVISPESFQRFSDGVLQAAFLRAARGSEIAYGNCDEQVSTRMFAFLCDELEAAKYGRGPALMEYVISLMIGRLTLHTAQTERFLDRVAAEVLIPESIRLCAQFARTA
jgi:hypothetical protein